MKTNSEATYKYDLKKNQIEEIGEAFKILDREDTSTIGPDQLTVALKALGLDPSKEEVKKLIEQVIDKNLADGDSDNTQIDESEFKKIMDIKINEQDIDEKKLTRGFYKMSTNGGTITLEDL
mmetsp:Transcript_21231/g.17620  ORF Transcript_21231/g.17620 Transcript_21231/m.17620 type:complete len:122 (+) Transcript_21231:17-382(+)